MAQISWLNGVFGDWNTASLWSTGTVPGSGDSVSIAAAGTYDVTLFGQGMAMNLAIAAPGATFYDAGSLALGGTLSLQAGTLALAYGAIDGGTLALAGGSFVAGGGMLDGVAVQGVLDLQQSQASLFVSGGLALSGAAGSGTGSVALTGAGASLDFLGSQTLNNAIVSIGASGGQGVASLGVSPVSGAQAGATLTLGTGLWLQDFAGNGELSAGASAAGTLTSLPVELLSEGTLTVSGAGAALLVAGSGTFVNQGSLAVANGATLTLACGSFANTGTMTVSDATLALGGVFASSALGSLGALTLSGGTVSITGTAENAGSTLSLGAGSAIEAALGQIALAGTLVGGVVQDGGGGLGFASGSGVLDGVSYEGTLDLSGGGVVTLTGGSSIEGQGGAGAASVLDTGAGSALLLQGSETLNHVTVALGGTGQTAVLGTSDAFLASTATTAVLGRQFTIQQSGALAKIEANGSAYPGLGPDDTLVSEGLIAGATTGGQLAISGFGTFINQGRLSVSNGDTLTITPSVFSNTGTILVGSGATAILGGPAAFPGVIAPVWSNTGTIIVSGGTLVLSGTMATAQLGQCSVTGGSVSLAGTLENAGATLALGGANFPALSLSGTIMGGSIADPGAALAAGAAGTGVLDGVSYQGTLGLAAPGALLRIRDGLALSGTATITGAGAVLAFWGTQTFDAATVVLGASGEMSAIDVQHDYSVASGSTLTLGPNLTVTQAGALAAIGLGADLASDAIVNDGTIAAAVAGGLFTLGGSNFSNQGSIAVSGGGTLSIVSAAFSNTGVISVTNAALSIGGSLTLAELGALTLTNASVTLAGTVNLAGATLSLGSGSAMGHVSLTGTIEGGTVADGGGGLSVAGDASLDAVTYAGVLDLSRPFAQLSLGGGTTLTGAGGTLPGTLLLTGAAARVVVTSSETISNALIDLGSAAATYLGQRIAPAELAAGPGATLTLAASTILSEAGTIGVFGDTALGGWSDSIVNDGQITNDLRGGTLVLGSSFFTNAGGIAVGAGAEVQTADVGFTNLGSISIGASAAFVASEYEYFAAPDPGDAVFTNDGTIELAGGLLQEVTANGLFPTVPLVNTAGALIQGNGIVAAAVTNQGTIEATGGLLSLYGPVSGTGTILIDPGASLNPTANMPAGVTVTFADPPQGSAGGTLILLQPGNFTANIAGLGTGDVLDLQTTHLSSIAVAGGTLVAGTPTMTDRFSTPGGVGASAVSVGTDKFGGSTIALTRQTIAGGAASIAVSQPGMLFWCSYLGDTFVGATKFLNGARISDWAGADHLDFTDLSPTSVTLSYSVQSGYGLLYLSEGTTKANVTFFGTFVGADFHASADGHGGTTISYHA